MTQEGHVEWWARTCAWKRTGCSCYAPRTDVRGGPWRLAYFVFLFKALTKQQWHTPEMCLLLLPPSWLFPPHSDGILLFRHTVCLNVWLEVLWLQMHLFYLIQMPIALVGSDWQVDTLVRVTGFCSAQSDCRATLTAPHQREEPSGLRGKQHPGFFTVSLGFRICMLL